MPKQVRLRRGTTAQHATFVGADGEVTFDTTKKILVLHDGVTPGGKPLDGFLVLNPGNPLVVQEIKGCLAITGGDSDTDTFTVSNPSRFTGSVTVDHVLTAKCFMPQSQTLIYAPSLNIDFAAFLVKKLDLTGNVSLTGTNMTTGRQVTLRIRSDGSARTLAFPAGWKFVGGATPANIAANKSAVLQLFCFGSAETDVCAQYLVEP
jgi:hypothetical protein